MTDRNASNYFAQREQQEREAAARTRDAIARRVHLDLADRYAAKCAMPTAV